MTINRTSRLGGLALAGALIVAACGGNQATGGPTGGPTGGTSAPPPGGGALSGTVTIDGSSTVFPITELVAEDFEDRELRRPGARRAERHRRRLQVKFCAGETDINDASRPIKADDAAEGVACDGQRHRVHRAPDRDRRPHGRREPRERLRDLPDARGAGRDLRAGLAAGPQVERRRRRASRMSRSSGSCPGADSARSTTSPRSSTARSTRPRRTPTQSEDDNVLVTGVAGDTNAIGFFGFAYYVENQDKLKAVEVDGGSGCVAPTESTINDGTLQAALTAAVHLPERRRGEGAARAQGVRRLLPRRGRRLRLAEVGYIAEPDATCSPARSRSGRPPSAADPVAPPQHAGPFRGPACLPLTSAPRGS